MNLQTKYKFMLCNIQHQHVRGISHGILSTFFITQLMKHERVICGGSEWLNSSELPPFINDNPIQRLH